MVDKMFLDINNYNEKLEEDARLVLFLFLSTACMVLHFSLFSLCASAFIYTFTFIKKAIGKKLSCLPVKLLSCFCIVWFFLTFALKVITYQKGSFMLIDIPSSFFFSFSFVLRLYVLGLLGLCTFIWLSAKEYALVLAWFFSFFSKEHGWKVGLVSLLVLRFFTDILKLAKELQISVKYRMRKKRNTIKNISLYMTSLLNMLSKRNYAISVALFVRGLNQESAFKKKWLTSSFSFVSFLKIHRAILLLFFLSFFLFALEQF